MNYKPAIKEASDWDRFVLEHHGSFLQSWAWGEFQKRLERQVWRIKLGQIIRHKLALGRSYLYCPRGPIGRIDDFLSTVDKIKEKKDIFLRIEPSLPLLNPPPPQEGEEIGGGGFKKLPWDIQPSKTIILDTAKSEEELLAQMHHKHRYNIRLAERKGVQVTIVDTADMEKYFDSFWQLLKETARRNKFHLHPKDYYKKQLAIQDDNLKIVLFVAEYQGEIIAANIVNFFGSRLTYMHGGSSYKYRNLMAPHLLQWEQIREAKRQGCREYDFWGIDEKKWSGITRFKRGFGGREVLYPGTFDLAFNKFWYRIYRLGRKLL